MIKCHETHIEECLVGKKLYGDEFSDEEIARWYRDEEEAYASLGAKHRTTYQYVYHQLNHFHGFARLPTRRFENALGIGSAYGDEFKPISNRIDEITILDPSGEFMVQDVDGVNVNYQKPSPSGEMPFGSETFDLVTCFGTLHHIPNVSFVTREIFRVTRNGGFVLIREPVVNMGDWRKPRPGLTKRERGIPLHIMQNIIESVGLRVTYQSPCVFNAAIRAARIFSNKPYFNSLMAVRADSVFSRLFLWNLSYDRRPKLRKIAPSCFYWVCTKP